MNRKLQRFAHTIFSLLLDKLVIDAFVDTVYNINMNKNVNELITQLDAIFYPKSIAIVGLPRGLKAGKLFLIALQEQKYSGAIYPVHPEAKEIEGIKAYPNISEIPGTIDLAIILVPHNNTLPIVKECIAKGVKGAILFSAGYKETGTDEGRKLEQELTQAARSSGLRLFGPNCMGLYVPKSGLSFFPGISRTPGSVGFISHSGSLANILARIAPDKGIYYSKSISLGNECDITASHLLTYLGNDPETSVIGLYLENVSNGRNFLNALKTATEKKPVLIWKVGLNPEGLRAASSHTGALATQKQIWDSVVRQGCAIPVTGLDCMIDFLMGFSLLQDRVGERIAILSGPGGIAVATAEACGNEGLKLAKLSTETQSSLQKFIPPTGTSMSNPVDVGLTASLEINIYKNAARVLASDTNVDAIFIIGVGFDRASNEAYTNEMIRIHKEFKKPFVMINIPGFDTDLPKKFCQAGIPFFSSAEMAVTTYANVMRYQRRRKRKV